MTKHLQLVNCVGLIIGMFLLAVSIKADNGSWQIPVGDPVKVRIHSSDECLRVLDEISEWSKRATQDLASIIFKDVAADSLTDEQKAALDRGEEIDWSKFGTELEGGAFISSSDQLDLRALQYFSSEVSDARNSDDPCSALNEALWWFHRGGVPFINEPELYWDDGTIVTADLTGFYRWIQKYENIGLADLTNDWDSIKALLQADIQESSRTKNTFLPDSAGFYPEATVGSIRDDDLDNILAWAEDGVHPNNETEHATGSDELQDWPLWSEGDPVPENWTRVPAKVKVYTHEIHTPNWMTGGHGGTNFNHLVVVTEWTVVKTKWLPSDDIRDWVKNRESSGDRSNYEHLGPFPDGNIKYNETYEVLWSPKKDRPSGVWQTIVDAYKGVIRGEFSNDVTVFQSQAEFEEWKKGK